MKKGFTLIEMLIVIGIIAVLTGASISGFSAMRKSAERARARELCLQIKTALEAIWSEDGIWPKTIRQKNSAADSILDEEVAYILASRGKMNLTYDTSPGSTSRKTTGADRFGVLSPWGYDVVKRRGSGASLTTKVGKGTVQDHLFRFKVDLDGDGVIDGASVGGESVNIRATAAVWCAGKDGVMKPYSKGLKSDDIYSWAPGQAVNVK